MLADGEEDARQAASPSLGPFQSNMSSDFSSMADFGLAARVDPPQVSFTANADLPMRNPGPVPGDQPDFSFADEITFSAFREVGGLNELWQQTSFNTPFWFDEPEFGWSEGGFDVNDLIPVEQMTSSEPNMTKLMQDYFDGKSRAPSPTLDKSKAMWYSEAPDLKNHDTDVLNVFLNLFHKHIPETFPLFAGTTVNAGSKPEYYLVMAAIGGLFCSVPGSHEVAKSMYNDARRLLLATVKLGNPEHLCLPREESLANVRTSILLGLYGLCSGDKRSYEFVEAFQGDLTLAVQEYSRSCSEQPSDSTSDIDNARLLEALYIMDCYRVIIMQRPPSHTWSHVECFARQQTVTNTRTSQLANLVTALTCQGQSVDGDAAKGYGLAGLAALSSYLWPVIYPCSSEQSVDAVGSGNNTLWKADFVEVACNTWLNTAGPTSTPSSKAIYHLMNIMLHANLTSLQSFAHSPPGSATRDPRKSLTGKQVYSWIRSRHYQIARWHAESLTRTIENEFTAAGPGKQTPRRFSDLRPLLSSSSSYPDSSLPSETPHVPYAIYFATVVLWCGAVTAENSISSPATVRAYLARGEQILSQHKVRIAHLLALVLQEIR